MQNFNYQEIRTPTFEQTGLFARSIGELTDIVSKEMYTFLDRSEESITLRPEGTAATLRAYIQNNLGEQSPLTKVYYIGPMFRQERRKPDGCGNFTNSVLKHLAHHHRSLTWR